jgi:hypothetical protein
VKRVFTDLGFTVEVKENLTGHEIYRLMSETAFRSDLGEFDIFVCFLMAHGFLSGGKDDVIFGSDNRRQTLRNLWHPFQASVCDGLSHKPKLFFVQACRMSQAVARRVGDVAVRLQRETEMKTDTQRRLTRTPYADVTAISVMNVGNESTLEDEDEDEKWNLHPVRAEDDFLFAHANTKDSVAFRDPNTGSVFVQTLCEVIEESGRDHDLMSLLVQVNGRIARLPAPDGCLEGPVVCFESRLRKSVMLGRRLEAWM